MIKDLEIKKLCWGALAIFTHVLLRERLRKFDRWKTKRQCDPAEMAVAWPCDSEWGQSPEPGRAAGWTVPSSLQREPSKS